MSHYVNTKWLDFLEYLAEKLNSPKEQSRTKLLDALSKKTPVEISGALSDFEKFLKTPEDKETEKAVLVLADAQREVLEKRDRMKLKYFSYYILFLGSLKVLRTSILIFKY